ncbi:hypothetical protein ABW18_05515 [Gordonia jacobaea]|uniref:Uncharacterized protein n=2 Tax=Gordoniaceae TaxID=85026 RepID=A0ABR5IGG4_9ACTN|nr:hypothetical protein ABW18_05515 [Gordonia jacobaea]
MKQLLQQRAKVAEAISENRDWSETAAQRAERARHEFHCSIVRGYLCGLRKVDLIELSGLSRATIDRLTTHDSMVELIGEDLVRAGMR